MRTPLHTICLKQVWLHTNNQTQEIVCIRLIKIPGLLFIILGVQFVQKRGEKQQNAKINSLRNERKASDMELKA